MLIYLHDFKERLECMCTDKLFDFAEPPGTELCTKKKKKTQKSLRKRKIHYWYRISGPDSKTDYAYSILTYKSRGILLDLAAHYNCPQSYYFSVQLPMPHPCSRFRISRSSIWLLVYVVSKAPEVKWWSTIFRNHWPTEPKTWTQIPSEARQVNEQGR